MGSKTRNLSIFLIFIVIFGVVGVAFFWNFFRNGTNSQENTFLGSIEPFTREKSNRIQLTETSGQCFYFANDGNQNNDGLTPTTPKRSYNKFLWDYTLGPGDQLFLHCGDTFTDTLYIDSDGSAESPIIISSYSHSEEENPDKPIIDGHKEDIWAAISITGNYIEVMDIQVQNCDYGIAVENVHHVNISWNYATKNMVGISLDKTVACSVSYNTIAENQRMASDTPGPDDDYGAQGILVSGNYSNIGYNVILNQWAKSDDYVTDGAAIEIYEASHNIIHHNFASGNECFTEIGQSSTIPITYNNSFINNILFNERTHPLLVLHCESAYGPAYNTHFHENIVIYNRTPSQSYGPIIDLVEPKGPFEDPAYFNVSDNQIYTTHHPAGTYQVTAHELDRYNASYGYFRRNHIYYLTSFEEETDSIPLHNSLIFNATESDSCRNYLYFVSSIAEAVSTWGTVAKIFDF